ncbi:hypothetical protein [Streptomyces parvulus]|uniref:hypothetical protein n=1 Tax=Streptomyces parvulus TaxID=146923 RepID=UPI0037F32D70
MTTQDADLDDIVRDFFDSRAPLDELMAAREADARREPHRTIIPEPVMPPLWPHPDSGIMRFPCGLGCGWSHSEDVYDDGPPVSVRLGASAEEIGRVFAERAEQRGAQVRARIEAAVLDHFAQEHAGVEPPVREVW